MNRQVRNIVIYGTLFQLVMQLVMLFFVKNTVAAVICAVGAAACIVSLVFAFLSARKILRTTLLVQGILAFLVLPANLSFDSWFLCVIMLLFCAAGLNISERSKLDFGIKTDTPEVHTYEELDPRFEIVMGEYFNETKRQCRVIHEEEGRPEITDNKLGGAPYIPIGMEVPHDKNGEEMSLLLQVNLRDVNLPDWPKKGIFEVFCDTKWDYPTEFKALVLPEGKPFKATHEIENQFLVEPVKISLDAREVYAIMPYEDYRREKILLDIINRVFESNIESDDDIAELVGSGEWCDMFNEYADSTDGCGSTIGGYAHFAQEDIRDAYPEETEALTETLFNLWGDLNAVCIGDAGFLFGFISPEALKAGELDKAVIDWDCY